MRGLGERVVHGRRRGRGRGRGLAALGQVVRQLGGDVVVAGGRGRALRVVLVRVREVLLAFRCFGVVVSLIKIS